jgi:hypothetical protein
MRSCSNPNELFFGLVPLAFTLLILLSSRYEDRFIERKTSDLRSSEELDRLVRREDDGTIVEDISIDKLLTTVAKSAVIVRNHMAALFGGIISILVAFQLWPPSLQFYSAIAILVIFVALTYRWTLDILSMNLIRISTGEYEDDSRPSSLGRIFGGRHSTKRTFARAVSQREIVLTVFLMIALSLGYVLKSCYKVA